MDSATTDPPIETMLLLGLPACGKSTIRRYLSATAEQASGRDRYVGPTVQLDDFPYVHFLWQIHDALTALGREPVLFDPRTGCFGDMRDWGTFMHLLNEDYAALAEPRRIDERSAAEWIIGRLVDARARVGIRTPELQPGTETRRAVAAALADEAAGFAAEWSARHRPEGGTVVIEFARGGPDGADMPLRPPWGYGWALSLLSAEILSHAVVLYVWVTPEGSRHRNRSRAEPGAHGSTMVHAVPESVMYDCYGTDDMGWLIEQSERPGAITVESQGTTFHVPCARIDNRREVPTASGADAAVRDPALEARLASAMQEAFEALTAGPPRA